MGSNSLLLAGGAVFSGDVLYATEASAGDDALYLLDPNTAAETLVGDLDAFLNSQGLDEAPDGTIYMMDSIDALYILDVGDASLDFVGNVPIALASSFESLAIFVPEPSTGGLLGLGLLGIAARRRS